MSDRLRLALQVVTTAAVLPITLLVRSDPWLRVGAWALLMISWVFLLSSMWAVRRRDHLRGLR